MPLKRYLSFNMYEALLAYGETSAAAPYLLLVLSLITIFPTLGVAGLANWDEAIYATVARTMVQTGDYFHLTFNNQPYVNKPPLFMFLTSLVYRFAGVSEFTARLIAALFGVANLFMGYMIIRKFFSRGEAFICSLLLLSNYHFLGVLRHGRMESMVSFFILVGLYAIFMCREDGRWLYLMVCAMLLGVFTKGPLGLLPLFFFAPVFFLDSRIRKQCSAQRMLFSFSLFALCIAVWLYFQYRTYDQASVNYFIRFQVLERLISPIEGHTGTVFFYPVVIMFQDYSSWGLIAPLSLVYVSYRAFREKSFNRQLISLCLWIMLGMFTAIQTKLHWYIFPAYIPLAFSCTYLLGSLTGKTRFVREMVIILSAVLILGFNVRESKAEPSFRDLSGSFASYLVPSDTIIAYRINAPSLNFYSGCIIATEQDEARIREKLKTPGLFFVMREKHYSDIVGQDAVEVLGRNSKHVFFRTIPSPGSSTETKNGASG